MSCVLQANPRQKPSSWDKRNIAHLLRSIQPTTSRLSPSVFAASRRRRCVPLSIARWSTRLSSTSRPCAKNSSSRASVPRRKSCSCSACASRLAPRYACAPLPLARKGLSGAVSDVDAAAKRRLPAPGVRGVPVLVEKSSVRCSAVRWYDHRYSLGDRREGTGCHVLPPLCAQILCETLHSRS